MMALPLALALALAAPGTPARNRPASRPTSTSAAEAAPAADLSDAEVAERVRTYLGAIDSPVRADQWRALGTAAVPVLEAVAKDPEALPTRRAKAVGALSVLGGTRARRVVLDVARSEEAPFAVRASALDGAGHLLAAKDLVRELRPVMEKAADAPVRATAAEILARHAPRSTCGAVRAQAARERDDGRSSFGAALERCGHSGHLN